MDDNLIIFCKQINQLKINKINDTWNYSCKNMYYVKQSEAAQMPLNSQVIGSVMVLAIGFAVIRHLY